MARLWELAGDELNGWSPYLVEHAGNPVRWWTWSDEAFDEAIRRDVPVFLSIGYASCHWCHVMAHESFEDAATAALLNDKFVSIKVDREERPDVDAVYMAAVQGLTGQGGWPMSVFLNHARQPFHAGTYFPREPRAGMPSFTQVLTAVSDTWVRRRAEVDQTAGQIAATLAGQQLGAGIESGTPDLQAVCDAALEALIREFDPVNGGFGSAPKFPPSSVLEYLIRCARRTESLHALAMIDRTCEAMALGGMYDQLAGGFARYSVDAQWMVPHFEKMLYDNAMLLRVYTHWYELTGSALAERVVHQTAQFLIWDLATEEGGFASGLDADAYAPEGGNNDRDGSGIDDQSDQNERVGPDRSLTDQATIKHEGASYVWWPQQLADVLGDELGAVAAGLFAVTDAGTFEAGSSVLQLTDPQFPVQHPETYTTIREALLAARGQRPQPARDDKVITAWNGLAIAALADAGLVFDRPEWIEAATRCAELIAKVHLREDGTLLRSSRAGIANQSAAGVLEDYGDLCEGLIALAAASGDNSWLTIVGGLLETALNEFANEEGSWFDTAASGEQLIIRPCDPTDLAAPSGWSAITNALIIYGTVAADERLLRAGQRSLNVLDPLGRKAPRFAGWLLATAESMISGPWEVVIVGDRDDPSTQQLRNIARASQPSATVLWGPPSNDGPFRDRPMLGGVATAYACHGSVCFPPAISSNELIELLRQ